MSTDITTFVFPESNHEVRSQIIDGEPWFVAKDVCDVLEISNVSQAVARLDETEKGISQIYTFMGEQATRVVNESGLYALIVRSDKPNAVKFRRWVTGEVLPSIRKTGLYALDIQKSEQITLLMHMMLEDRKDMIMMQQTILVMQQDISRLVELAERNEPKLTTHDLLVASDLELTMRETGAILGFRDVSKFTATLRESRILIKKQYTVSYDGKTYRRHRNTPTAKWRNLINVRSQFSGENVVTVPYAKPQAVAAIHLELERQGHDMAPLPSVDEQRAIVAEVRRRDALETHDDTPALD